MKCPVCVKIGKQSHVYPRGVTKTCLGWQPYYDEDGNYINNDPNTTTEYFDCNQGHSFVTKTCMGETEVIITKGET